MAKSKAEFYNSKITNSTLLFKVVDKHLCLFTPLFEDYVSKLIVSFSSATCDNDTMPTFLVKECLDVILPTITRIVNLSLVCGIFPSALKSARVGQLHKKPTLVPEQFKSYHPVRNLPFLSNVFE